MLLRIEVLMFSTPIDQVDGRDLMVDFERCPSQYSSTSWNRLIGDIEGNTQCVMSVLLYKESV